MRTWSNRDILLRDINADTQALGIYIREMMLGLFRIFMRHIEAHMIDCMNLHLIIYRTSHYITRSQGQARVILMHKLLTVRQPQNTSVSAHRFSNQISRVCLFGIEQTRWVELHKLHIFDHSFGTIDHGDTVSGSDLRIGGRGIDGTCSSGSHQSNTTEIGIYFLRLRIQDIRSVALNIRSTACHAHT